MRSALDRVDATVDVDHLGRGLGEPVREQRDARAGSSQSPGCALVLADPPDAEAGEITDKGYVNQRAVLARRADAVQRLFASKDASVIRCNS